MSEKSPFVHTDAVIPPVFAGRDKELSIINKVLFHDQESIALFGNDAIGKSSIIKTVHTQLLANRDSKILPINLNAFDFLLAVEIDFLGIITHQLCATIWTKIMRRNYSELIEENLLNVRGDIINFPQELAIKRIYRILSSDKLSGVGKINKEIGGKFFVEGKLSSENGLTTDLKKLASFEFLHILDELIAIVNEFNYNSIILICDELNHYPNSVNSEFLRTYFDIFASRNIKFLITVVNPNSAHKKDAQLLLDSFNQPLEITHFSSVEAVEQLILNVLLLDNKSVYFENETFDILFEKTGGHPWWIQKICDSAYTYLTNTITNRNSEKIISNDLIVEHAELFKDEIELYKREAV